MTDFIRATANRRDHMIGEGSIADTVDDVTPQWMTSALRAGGTITADTSVSSVQAQPFGTGQSGLVSRAELEYAGAVSSAPRSVIVKLPSADEGSRQMNSALGLYEAEVRFFQQIAPRLGRVVPAVHWCDVEPSTGRFTVILDDLTRVADVGDMVAGGTMRQAELAIGVLAELQAPIWDDPILPQLDWASITKTEMLFAGVAPAIDSFVERFGERLKPAHVDLARRLAPKAAGSAQRLWKPPYVIAHGDYRLDNMMFGRKRFAQPITVIDWQACRVGPPLLDATIFMGSCMSIEQRRADEERLLHRYHDSLRAAGVSDFSCADVRASYRMCSLYPFLLTIAVAVTLQRTERGDEMWAQMFANSAAIVQDTNAAALLD
jgi:hypothetical protein